MPNNTQRQAVPEPETRATKRKAGPRTGWGAAAKRLREREKDHLLEPPVPTRFDEQVWTW